MVLSRSCALRGAAVGAVLLAVLVGCQSRRGAECARCHRTLANADGPAVVPPGVVLASPTDLVDGLRPPRHVLALSSGGLYGA